MPIRPSRDRDSRSPTQRTGVVPWLRRGKWKGKRGEGKKGRCRAVCCSTSSHLIIRHTRNSHTSKGSIDACAHDSILLSTSFLARSIRASNPKLISPLSSIRRAQKKKAQIPLCKTRPDAIPIPKATPDRPCVRVRVVQSNCRKQTISVSIENGGREKK
jgi:hypothetical protein